MLTTHSVTAYYLLFAHRLWSNPQGGVPRGVITNGAGGNSCWGGVSHTRKQALIETKEYYQMNEWEDGCLICY